MRLNTAIVIAAVTLVMGLLVGEGPIWIPATVLGAGIVDLLTRSWTSSNRIGASGFSVVLKTVFLLVGFYAAIGQFVCVGLMLWWLFT
jgi:hypothetical protein